MNHPNGEPQRREPGREGAQLRRARDLLQMMVASLKDYALLAMDRRRILTYWNSGAERVFGYGEEEVLGKSADMLFTDKDREAGVPAAEMELAVRQGFAEDERWHRRKDGSLFWASGRVRPMQDESGRIIGFIKLARDMTERKRMEEALREGEERSRLLLNSTLEGIYGLDVQGRCIFANARCLDILGFTREADLVGQDMHALIHRMRPDGSPYPPEQCPILRALHETHVLEIENEHFVRPDGSFLPVELRCSPMIREGRLAGMVVTFLDLSERQRMRRALREAEERRFEAQKLEAVGRLAGGVAHEFNNALTAVNGYANLLLGLLPDADPKREMVQEILKAGEKAAFLTRQLLAFGRRQMLSPRVVDLNQIVARQEGLLRALVGERIELSLALDPRPGLVRVDPAQMEQSLVHLCENAREAMPVGGRVTVETRAVGIDLGRPSSPLPPGAYIRLSVSDTGKGLDPAAREKVLEPFYSTKEMGTDSVGLGLPSIYGFVRQSGGYLDIAGGPGQGTTVHIYFPEVAEKEEEHKPIAMGPAGRQTVLVVEDEKNVRGFMAMVLRNQGYSVLEASHPDEGVHLAENHAGAIDLVIADINIPGMKVVPLTARLRGCCPGMGLLLISGHADAEALREAPPDLPSDFLAKPFSPQSLLEKVAGLVERKASAGAPAPGGAGRAGARNEPRAGISH